MSHDAQNLQPLAARRRAARQSAFLVPLLLFAAIAALLAAGLTLNPREIPARLIGKPVPQLELSPVQGRALGIATADLKGEVSIVKVFASWCIACKDEHPVFVQMQRERLVSIHGLIYKDRPEDGQKWLQEMGDRYSRTGADPDGRLAIEWDVYGVLETFVIDPDGRIAYKHIGSVTPKLLDKTLRPLIARLRQ